MKYTNTCPVMRATINKVIGDIVDVGCEMTTVLIVADEQDNSEAKKLLLKAENYRRYAKRNLELCESFLLQAQRSLMEKEGDDNG